MATETVIRTMDRNMTRTYIRRSPACQIRLAQSLSFRSVSRSWATFTEWSPFGKSRSIFDEEVWAGSKTVLRVTGEAVLTVTCRRCGRRQVGGLFRSRTERAIHQEGYPGSIARGNDLFQCSFCLT